MDIGKASVATDVDRQGQPSSKRGIDLILLSPLDKAKKSLKKSIIATTAPNSKKKLQERNGDENMSTALFSPVCVCKFVCLQGVTTTINKSTFRWLKCKH